MATRWETIKLGSKSRNYANAVVILLFYLKTVPDS